MEVKSFDLTEEQKDRFMKAYENMFKTQTHPEFEADTIRHRETLSDIKELLYRGVVPTVLKSMRYSPLIHDNYARIFQSIVPGFGFRDLFLPGHIVCERRKPGSYLLTEYLGDGKYQTEEGPIFHKDKLMHAGDRYIK